MAIKFEKIEAGMTLLDIHKHQRGHTTMRELGCWRVHVVSVDKTRRTAAVSWNGNKETVWNEAKLTKLYAKAPPKFLAQQERKGLKPSQW